MSDWKKDLDNQLGETIKQVEAQDAAPIEEPAVVEDDDASHDPYLLRRVEEMLTEIKDLTGLDFESGRADIQEMIKSRLNGNWDVSCDFGNGLPGIRLVQEDEFDQHREGNEDLEDLDDDYDFTVGGDYVWVERNGWEDKPTMSV